MYGIPVAAGRSSSAILLSFPLLKDYINIKLLLYHFRSFCDSGCCAYKSLLVCAVY